MCLHHLIVVYKPQISIVLIIVALSFIPRAYACAQKPQTSIDLPEILSTEEKRENYKIRVSAVWVSPPARPDGIPDRGGGIAVHLVTENRKFDYSSDSGRYSLLSEKANQKWCVS